MKSFDNSERLNLFSIDISLMNMITLRENIFCSLCGLWWSAQFNLRTFNEFKELSGVTSELAIKKSKTTASIFDPVVDVLSQDYCIDNNWYFILYQEGVHDQLFGRDNTTIYYTLHSYGIEMIFSIFVPLVMV
jgi:hypothetical protein